MKKIIIMLFITFSLVSCTDNKLESNNSEKDNSVIMEKESNLEENNFENGEKTMEEKLEDIKLDGEEYGDLKDFIRKDLEEDDKQVILKILEQRKEEQKTIIETLEKAIIEGNFDEKFVEIKAIRSIYKTRILPYIIIDKKETFSKMSNDGNIRLKAFFISKMNKIKARSNNLKEKQEENEKQDKITEKIKEINEKKKEELEK